MVHTWLPSKDPLIPPVKKDPLNPPLGGGVDGRGAVLIHPLPLRGLPPVSGGEGPPQSPYRGRRG